MSVDPSVLKALQAAVDADPENPGLRRHFAGLLLQADLPNEALIQLQAGLAQSPADLDLIDSAGQAASAAGKQAVAEGYRRLSEALRWNSAAKLVGEEPEPIRLPAQGRPEADRADLPTDRTEATLADVAGMEDVKQRLTLAFLGPMKNPEMRAAFRKSLKGGLLLYGPPGCGKTHLARALAGELQARFMSIGLSDVLDMYLGESEKNLHEIFESARRLAPIVLFFDEVDALGRKRSLTREHAGRNNINQLLDEMDGINAENDGLYVLGATNHPWDIDSALLRPGRFDRSVLVTPPDDPARKRLLEMALDGRPVGRIDFGRWARETEGFSGADMVHLVDSAAEFALADSLSGGAVRAIGDDDLKAAIKSIRPSTRTWLETAKKHVVYSNEGGRWDDLKAFLKSKRIL